ncbi:MotE family protein [Lysinibacillus sp. 54212]|uniref:MotE family protein n=1 Tax=Lysinibacillus sp. 54212 TaxID=3119829 RepID=UPI002FCC375B
MAKNDAKKIENERIDEIEKKPGFFQKLFFWFLIPVLFTVAILLIIATVTNTNVFQFADKVTDSLPFVSSKEDVVENTSLSKEKIVKLQAEIQEKEAQITQLQSEIESASSEKEELVIEQERLLYEIETLKRTQEENKLEFAAVLDTYKNMSAKSAAPILVEMSEPEALRIMSNLDAEQLSAIFSKMSPADAAKFTELLSQQ